MPICLCVDIEEQYWSSQCFPTTWMAWRSCLLILLLPSPTRVCSSQNFYLHQLFAHSNSYLYSCVPNSVSLWNQCLCIIMFTFPLLKSCIKNFVWIIITGVLCTSFLLFVHPLCSYLHEFLLKKEIKIFAQLLCHIDCCTSKSGTYKVSSTYLGGGRALHNVVNKRCWKLV